MRLAVLCCCLMQLSSACLRSGREPASASGHDENGVARARLEASLRAHGAVSSHPLLSLTCQGTLHDLGHYSRPRELQDYPLTRHTTFDFASRAVMLRSSLDADGSTYESKASASPHGATLLDFGESKPQPDSVRARARLSYQLAELAPSLLLTLALEAHALRSLPDTLVRGRAAHTLAFVDAAGQPHTLYLDAQNSLLLRSAALVHDELFGDSELVTDFDSMQRVEGLWVPAALRRSRLWFVEEELRCVSTTDAVALGELPRAEPVATPHVSVEDLGHGLHLIKLHHLNNRTLFLELADSVIAFEAPLDSATGELILDTIDAATGHKPVRYLVLSHHHPDYIGGIRAFVARGTTIVTTPGNVSYVEQIARAPRSLVPDALQRAPRELHVEAVRGKLTLGEGERRVELFDIGKHSHHTDEYLVHYFPASRLLFEGDLVGARADAPRPLSERGRGLLSAIDELGLSIDVIYESWPLRGSVESLPLARLRELAGS